MSPKYVDRRRPEPRRRDRPPRGVTREQHRTIQTLACLTLLHGRTPALSELGQVLGCSKQAVFYRLHWLEKKGLWRRSERAITAEGLLSALGVPPAGTSDARLELNQQKSLPPIDAG